MASLTSPAAVQPRLLVHSFNIENLFFTVLQTATSTLVKEKMNTNTLSGGWRKIFWLRSVTVNTLQVLRLAEI